MADTKFSESEQDCAPEDLWTLIKQLRIYDLVIAIQQTVLDDIQRIINLARDRPFTLADFTSLNKEFFEMCEDLSIFTALTSVICTILLFYLGILAWSSLTGPAAEPVTVAQSTSGAEVVFDTVQSVAMAGYESPVVIAFVQGTIVAGGIFAAYKLWNMHKRKNT